MKRLFIAIVFLSVSFNSYSCLDSSNESVFVYADDLFNSNDLCRNIRISIPKRIGSFDRVTASIVGLDKDFRHVNFKIYLSLTEGYEEGRLNAFVCLDDFLMKDAVVKAVYGSDDKKSIVTCTKEVVVNRLDRRLIENKIYFP